MSKQAVQDLLDKAGQDPTLNEVLESALATSDKPVEAFLAAARAQGCDFTADEFVEVVGALAGAGQPQELQEAELDAVAAAGMSWSTTALRTFSNYRLGPSISSIGIGGIYQQEGIEEDELPM